MAYNKTELTKVKVFQNYLKEYERKEILGGLISWWVLIKCDKIGKDLIIETSEKYDGIIINGEKIK